MFLLFRYKQWDMLQCFFNLHSNMFLLFHWTNIKTLLLAIIYIPIYFYYFRRAIIIRSPSRIHLHSNMFLLFRRIQLFARNSESIYIPICFYYFKSKRSQERQTHLIYIPICFYYFLYSSSILFCKFSFTFQYVSIISVMLIWYSIRKY